MIFYHGTDKKGLQAILSDRVLHGIRGTPSRATYLTPDSLVAQLYAKPYLLTVHYVPGKRLDNWYCGLILRPGKRPLPFEEA